MIMRSLLALVALLMVVLAWDRNIETEVVGYNLYRSTMPGSGYTKINTTLIPQPAVGQTPRYADQPSADGRYYYVVRAVNASGQESANSNEAPAVVDHVPPAVAQNQPQPLLKKGN